MLRICPFAVAAVIVLSVGCNETDPDFAHTISGTITLDGNLVEDGTITFFPNKKDVRNAGCKIKGGKYRCGIMPGEYRVEIRAPRVVGTVPLYEEGGPVRDITEESIPINYNDDSELEVIIELKDVERNFDLSSN